VRDVVRTYVRQESGPGFFGSGVSLVSRGPDKNRHASSVGRNSVDYPANPFKTNAEVLSRNHPPSPHVYPGLYRADQSILDLVLKAEKKRLLITREP
jgi:hypothetical protein